MKMTVDDRFDLIFSVGKNICAAYTGFSVSEVAYC